MKVVSTEGLTKLIQLVKSAFLAVDDVTPTTEVDIVPTTEITLANVATSGSYNDLSNKPTIPTVPTNVSAFTNDAGYITNSALNGYATESYVTTAVSGKQDTLVSGTNIKTINNTSLLGSGNIDIQGGGGGSSYTAGDGIIIQNDVISVDDEPIDEADTETVEEVTIAYLLSQITGYDATKTQSLKNVNGTLTWVTEV